MRATLPRGLDVSILSTQNAPVRGVLIDIGLRRIIYYGFINHKDLRYFQSFGGRRGSGVKLPRAKETKS